MKKIAQAILKAHLRLLAKIGERTRNRLEQKRSDHLNPKSYLSMALDSSRIGSFFTLSFIPDLLDKDPDLLDRYLAAAQEIHKAIEPIREKHNIPIVDMLGVVSFYQAWYLAEHVIGEPWNFEDDGEEDPKVTSALEQLERAFKKDEGGDPA